ncbi:MAG: hypothetical protein M1812_001783 [Candelaria pacifica]|nr:MAG: hypothetical protein M1812_001783 [Candelaria pacifica]
MVMDLIIWILLIAMSVYALISTNRYGFSRSTGQGSVPDANKYGGAVGSAFAWLAAILHLIMFIQASLESYRLKKGTATTISDTTDVEHAARKAQRASLAKVWLRAATVVISMAGFICFVAAIATNSAWYSIALNIEYWAQGQDTNQLTLALATDYFPLASFCLSLLLAGILYFFHYRHARKPRTTKPLHPIYSLIGDIFASMLFFTAVILAAAVKTYMYYFSFYTGRVCTDDHCAETSYTVNALKIAGISLAVVAM